MKKSDLFPYIKVCLDDTGAVRDMLDCPMGNSRWVVWQVGFEPVVVVVWSYLPEVRLYADEAEEIAIDYLEETKWFADGPFEPSYVL